MRVVRWWDSLPRATRIVMVVLPVTMAALAAWAFGEVVGQHHHQFDLRLYYDAINFWQSGHDLYSYAQPDPVNITLGFTYPPVAALLMSPMGLLSYPVVLVISLIAIIASAAVFVYLVLRERIRLPKPLMLAVAGVATAFAFTLEPFRQTLSFGQINIYLGLLVLVDLLVLGRRGSRWTGVGIGLATAIKLTPGIFIIYLLVVGRWRAALTAIGTVVGVNLLSALIAPSETWRYFTSLMWETSRVGFLDTTTNQSINGLLARLDAPFAPARLPWLILAADRPGLRVLAGPPGCPRRRRTRGHHHHRTGRGAGEPGELGAPHRLALPRDGDPGDAGADRHPGAGGRRQRLCIDRPDTADPHRACRRIFGAADHRVGHLVHADCSSDQRARR